MIIGFIGSRSRMSKRQLATLNYVLENTVIEQLHHGDTKGSTEQVHFISIDLGIPLVIHPPISFAERAFLLAVNASVTLPPRDAVSRNHHIVDCVDILIAVPETYHRVKNSLVWEAVSYCIGRNKPVLVIDPSGKRIRK